MWIKDGNKIKRDSLGIKGNWTGLHVLFRQRRTIKKNMGENTNDIVKMASTQRGIDKDKFIRMGQK